jgi:hypothetical protein
VGHQTIEIFLAKKNPGELPLQGFEKQVSG